MNSEQLKKLRQYYRSIRAQLPSFEASTGNILHPPVDVFSRELQSLLADFPGIVPALNLQEFFSHTSDSRRYYNVAGLRSYIATVLGRLEVLIDDTESTPVTEHKSFAFIQEKALRDIIERDFEEVQRCFIAKCWKSVIVLCGGLIEAILTDLLIQNPSATSASSAPKNSDVTKWDLADLIKVSVELKLVSASVEKLSSPIREYRNLVHPGNELRNKLDFGPEEARIALEVLNIVHRELS